VGGGVAIVGTLGRSGPRAALYRNGTSGATAAAVVHEQISAHERSPAAPDGHYQLGCLYIGVNDVRAVEWDAARFEADFRHVLAYLRERCDRLLALTAPLDLGRPRAGTKVGELNRVIERAAREHGALVLDLSDFGARNQVMTDHVHPTAFGQVAIAERALALLAGDGMALAVRPSTLVRYETSWWRRLRGDATYSYRHLKASTRTAAVLLRLRLRQRPVERLQESPADARGGAGSR